MLWCRRELNPRFLIQSSKTLQVELTEIHLLGTSLSNRRMLWSKSPNSFLKGTEAQIEERECQPKKCRKKNKNERQTGIVL